MNTPSPIKYKTPSRLNTFISLGLTVICVFLLIVGSKIEMGWMLALLAFLFAFFMIPVYSMIHEAEHAILHHNRKVNYLFGVVLSTLFMSPFTFFQQCHIGHHKRNRTDYEMFDLHYEHQSQFKRSLYLTIGRLGFQFLLLPFSVLLFLFVPWLVTSPVFRKDLMAEGMLSGLYKETLPRIRWESLGVVLFHALLIVGFDLAWQNYMIIYLIHGFVWSSHNYVNHAHSERDIIHGAHNHKLPKWLQSFYLNFNLHKAHHENPKVPWLYLEDYVDKEDPNRESFYAYYLRLWKGTILTHEPSPVPLDELRSRPTYQESIPLGGEKKGK